MFDLATSPQIIGRYPPGQPDNAGCLFGMDLGGCLPFFYLSPRGLSIFQLAASCVLGDGNLHPEPYDSGPICPPGRSLRILVAEL